MEQLQLHPKTKHKTWFITQQGQYQWNSYSSILKQNIRPGLSRSKVSLPFGLSNATTTFQTTKSNIFSGLMFKSVLVCADDIIVYSPSFDQHLRDLEDVFQRLRQHNLTLKPGNCHFAAQQFDCLGHVISKQGATLNPKKTAVIHTQMRRFTGLSNFYKK